MRVYSKWRIFKTHLGIIPHSKDSRDHSHYEQSSQESCQDVRIYGLKQEGGELFIRYFLKILKV